MAEPVIRQGDEIEVRDVSGRWHRTTALSDTRIDYQHALRRRDAWPSVSVQPDGWKHPINWPAEDVRLIQQPASAAVSLAPLDPLDALRGLLAVDPHAPPS